MSGDVFLFLFAAVLVAFAFAVATQRARAERDTYREAAMYWRAKSRRPCDTCNNRVAAIVETRRFAPSARALSAARHHTINHQRSSFGAPRAR